MSTTSKTPTTNPAIPIAAASRNPHLTSGQATRRKRGEKLDRCFSRDAGGEQIGRLLRAHKRAAEDLVEPDVQPAETGEPVLESNHAFFRQGTFVVIGPIVAALGGDRMTHDVKLTWRR
jgi:hypothetical protein